MVHDHTKATHKTRGLLVPTPQNYTDSYQSDPIPQEGVTQRRGPQARVLQRQAHYYNQPNINNLVGLNKAGGGIIS